MKISIVVPVYNICEYLDNCVNSLINQTYKNIEIILVDDGSTDDSGKRCDYFAQKDDRIKVVHKRNGGLSSARNSGIQSASGELLMFVDGDDYLALNAVEILQKIYKKYDPDIVQFCYKETVEPYSKFYSNDKLDISYITNTKEMFNKLYAIGGEAASSCTKLYKRSLFSDLKFEEGITHEDESIITYLLQKILSIVYIDSVLYFYVMRRGSIVKSNFSPKKMDIFFVIDDRMNQLNKLRFFDLLEKEKVRYFTTLVYLWSDAKNEKYIKDCSEMKHMMKIFLNKNSVSLSGYMKIIYILCKIHPNFICIYYYLKKLIHKF